MVPREKLSCDSIVAGLRSKDRMTQRKSFRELVDLSGRLIDDGGEEHVYAWRRGKACAGDLWKLTKENCYVKYQPFSTLLRKVGDLLSRNNGRELYKHFSDYWRDSDNFIPLGENIVDHKNIACAVVPREDAFLPLSLDSQDFMVDFDFTTRTEARKERMLRQYGTLFELLRNPCQVALVYKKYGPYGPERHRAEIMRELDRHAAVKNTFIFSQALGRPVADTKVKPDLPVMILYDLLATGEGLSMIARDIYAKCGLAINRAVSAMVVYAYDKSLLGEEKKSGRHRNFDELSLDEIKAEPGRLFRAKAAPKRLATAIYLYRGAEGRPSSLKAPVALSQRAMGSLGIPVESPFKRIQVGDIDPGAAAGYRFALADAAHCWRDNVIKTHAGDFCAMWEGKPLGYAKTESALVKMQREKNRTQYRIQRVPGATALNCTAHANVAAN
jgi:hypothetical protein